MFAPEVLSKFLKEEHYIGIRFGHRLNIYDLIYENEDFVDISGGEKLPLLSSPLITEFAEAMEVSMKCWVLKL